MRPIYNYMYLACEAGDDSPAEFESLSDDSFDTSAEIAGLAPYRKSDAFFKRGLEVPFLNFGEGFPRILCEESLFCNSDLDSDLESVFWRAPCERRGATAFRSGGSGGVG